MPQIGEAAAPAPMGGTQHRAAAPVHHLCQPATPSHPLGWASAPHETHLPGAVENIRQRQPFVRKNNYANGGGGRKWEGGPWPLQSAKSLVSFEAPVTMHLLQDTA